MKILGENMSVDGEFTISSQPNVTNSGVNSGDVTQSLKNANSIIQLFKKRKEEKV
jgi:hypothetical protein